jgi:hypothetical protein
MRGFGALPTGERAIILIMHRLHEEDLARAACWRRRIGTSCTFRRSPRTTRPTGSRPSWDGTHSPGGAAKHCTPSASRWRRLKRSAARLANNPRATSSRGSPASTSRRRRRRAAAVKAAWFGSYASNERPDAFDRIAQSWDTASKASELSDFSVCTNWGIKAKDLYLLLRRRMEYPELKRAVCEQAQAFDTNVKSCAFAENPVGVTYDPEEPCRR